MKTQETQPDSRQMESQHTPKWKAYKQAGGLWAIRDGSGFRVASELWGRDAKRIVMCVNLHDELVEALKAILTDGENMIAREGDPLSLSRCMAVTALAKAESQS